MTTPTAFCDAPSRSIPTIWLVLTMRPGEHSTPQQARIAVAALAASVRLAPRSLRGPGTGPSRPLIPIPDTAVCRHADEMARDTLSPAVYQHSRRCWEWAMALAEVDGLTPDPEALVVACLLHDLELGGDAQEFGCFAVAGGVAAADHCIRYGRTDLADVVSAAIAGHFAPRAGSGEVDRALHDAAHLDVAGHRVGEVTRAHVATVLDAFPRNGFRSEFGALIAVESRRRPASTAAVIRRVGLGAAMRLNPLERWRPTPTGSTTAEEAHRQGER
ncbi:HD domain-containing protein [Gordonia polyisoprenivorans]|uniref:HD domain-containing protein n=1 Tax=Gordonia polyisoprenivorans TaxID=84595 RepID=UPI001AD7940C|nr:HD domain-containing protein [Gordonia polyisoprenivorans]QTI71179.1 HD domain-containing protein [Gordonia polyisoprenivorans]